jgi:DNA-binding IclR family transcriptional regulator
MASLPDERVDEIIATHGLEESTQHTITDEAELREELASIREKGFAFCMGEHLENLWAVGAPIILDDGSVLGSIGIAGPVHRMKQEWFQEETPDHLLGKINELELKLAYE